jgi:serine/threonine protein kinase
MSNTSQRAAREQERRRRFQRKTPRRWCPDCTALVYADEEECFDCRTPRPDEGWPWVDESGDRFLGKILQDRYLVTRRVASGANARVYRADSRVIPRSFAIKIMDISQGPDLSTTVRQRLQEDVEALSALRNPHIVSFYDVFDLDTDHIVFVMDLIEGESLDELLRHAGALPPARTLGLLRQLANGILEAHARGLVHRDLKPSNVLIEKLPAGDDFVRILDFGVVWVRGTVRDTGAFDEAPVFSSPELISGQDPDARSDIYSIGALAFYMLTGKPPFSRSSVLENVNALLTEPIPTLEDVTGREFPASLEGLIARMMRREPDERPADLSEVIERLDAVADELALSPEEDHEGRGEEPTSSATGTSLGMIPSLGDGSSPVLALSPSEMSQVSEATFDAVEATGCRGEGYGFVRAEEVLWAGSFDGVEPGRLGAQMQVASMAVTADYALLGLADGSIAEVRPGGEAEVLFQDPRRAPITAVAMSPSHKAHVAGSSSGRLYVGTEHGWTRFGAAGEPVTALALSDKGDQFAVARGRAIQVMSLAASNLSSFPMPIDSDVVSMAFSPDDYLVAVLTDDGTVVLESVHTGQEMMRLSTGDRDLCDITFSADNHLMGLFREGDRVVLKQLT